MVDPICRQRPWWPLALGVAVLALMAEAPAEACSLVVETEDRFDYANFVFEAEVLGVVGPLRAGDWPGEAWGLRLGVRRAAHLPSPREEYDLVPLSLEADCSARAYTGEEIESRFAVGETVRVVAVESQLGSEVLRICPACGSYLEVVSRARSSAAERWGDGVTGLDEGGQVIDDFEYQVALLRLEAASSSAERAALLLALAPYLASVEALDGLLRHHPADPEVVAEMLRRLRRRHEAGGR